MAPTRARGAPMRTAHRQPPLARMTTLAGVAGLVLVAVVATSALLAALFDRFAGGIVLGAGATGLGWAISNMRRRLTSRRRPVPGRSRTLDCRRSRWHRARGPIDKPHFPVPADRRVVPCRNSRYPRT